MISIIQIHRRMKNLRGGRCTYLQLSIPSLTTVQNRINLIISTPDHFCSNCQQLSLCLYNSRMGVSHSAPVHSLSRLSLSVSELRVCLAPGRGSLFHVPVPGMSRPRPRRSEPRSAVPGPAGLRGNFYGQKAGAGDSSLASLVSPSHGTPVTELRAAGQRRY